MSQSSRDPADAQSDAASNLANEDEREENEEFGRMFGDEVGDYELEQEEGDGEDLFGDDMER